MLPKRGVLAAVNGSPIEGEVNPVVLNAEVGLDVLVGMTGVKSVVEIPFGRYL